MVPVRSEPTQPEPPSVLPTRLLPLETMVPKASGPLVPAVFFATMVLPRVTVPLALSRPPPERVAVLPLMVQLMSVVAEAELKRPPPKNRSGVAVDGAAGQRGLAVATGQ